MDRRKSRERDLAVLDKNICILVRAGHANALDYPLGLYIAAIDEINDDGK